MGSSRVMVGDEGDPAPPVHLSAGILEFTCTRPCEGIPLSRLAARLGLPVTPTPAANPGGRDMGGGSSGCRLK